jgi:GTP-binding protein EngB required for normal cell division
MIKIRELFRKICIIIIALFIATPGFAESDDIGDYGTWATEKNITMVKDNMKNELNNFGPKDTVINDNFVPLDAKIGLAFIGGMSKVGKALDMSLVRFAILFMLIAYAFWVSFEAYNLILAKENVSKSIKNIAIKGMWIAIWIAILNAGIAEIFMTIMGPVISLGTFISQTILDSVTSLTGQHLINNCAAIKQYAANTLAHTNGAGFAPGTLDSVKISSESAAELLCLPAQMSAFFMTIMKIGWQWIVSGVGFSLLSAVFGIYIIYLALKNLWKFLFISLDVIAELFLGVLLLPFTAIAETTAKTNYKGVAGDIFNSFLTIFTTEDLKKQINRVIKACIYFICLAITISVSLSLLTIVINPTTGQLLDYTYHDLQDVIILILILLLIFHLASKSQSLAEEWCGKLDAGFGTQLKSDVTRLWTISKEYWKKIRGKGGKSSNSGNSNNSGNSSGNNPSSNKQNNQNPDKEISPDIFLLGLPNSGKTALFSAIISKRLDPPAQITKDMQFGVMYTSSGGFILCDIPGISGTNLISDYLEYMKHMKLFIHVIDADDSDWVYSYKNIRNELNSYSNLYSKPEIIVISKIDTIDDATLNLRMNALQAHVGSSAHIVATSIITGDGINQLINQIKNDLH